MSDTQAKIVESVVGAMLKASTRDKAGARTRTVVVDEESRAQARDLLSATSGRPHWEANVAARNITKTTRADAALDAAHEQAQVGDQMQRSLDRRSRRLGLASASLAELSHPSNSLLRLDAPRRGRSRIRTAHERLNAELAYRRAARLSRLWELVEGGCTVLTTRFADFCGHILVQNRSSTGVSAMYVSHLAITTNAHQARVSLARLTKAARIYAARVPRHPSRTRRRWRSCRSCARTR